MYQPPHRRGAAGAGGSDRQVPRPARGRGSSSSVPNAARLAPTPASSSLPAVRQSGAIPSARQPPLPNTVLRARRDLSLPVGRQETPVRPTPPRFTSSPGPISSKPIAPIQVRRYSPAPSEMEMLASVARSGGDGAEGDALKDFGTQLRFRAYIEEKIHHYHNNTEDEGALQNIVRLFRKLREGIVASHRLDHFAIEAFESSVRYAVLARDAPQLLSALSGLVPDLYLAVDAAKADRKAKGIPEPHSDALERFVQVKSGCHAGYCPVGPAHKVTDVGVDHNCTDHSHSHHKHSSAPHSPVAGRCAPDDRSHFASLLLIYHLVHSPRNAFWETYQRLVYPGPRKLKRRDYSGALHSDSETSLPTTLSLPPPSALSTPFTKPENLMYARTAAQVLSTEFFDPMRFASMVMDEADHPDKPHDHPEALERALLAWASPRVREMAGERFKKAYMTASTEWVARVFNLKGHLKGEGGVMLWAMANGVTIKDGVVKLR